jgi:hypothetical protein
MRPPALAATAAILTLVLPQVAPSYAQAPCRNVAIRSPFRGETLQGRVPVLGSARIEGFQFYKVEWAPDYAPDQWSAVSTVKAPAVTNGLLDEWDTRRLPDGGYRLKLTVVDAAGQEVCRFVVTDLLLANRATPTATSSAGASPIAPAVATVTPDVAAAVPTAPVAAATATSPPAVEAPTASVVAADNLVDEGAPTGEPAATARPIAASAPAAGAASEAAPAALAAALGLRGWMDAFITGFAVSLMVITVLLLIHGLRR